MPEKPIRAPDYSSEQVELVRSTCLYVATKLGDLTDDVVVVGGLVPSLLVEQANLRPGVQPHVGTMDLDIGLKLALLDEGRYRMLGERLRDDPAPSLWLLAEPLILQWLRKGRQSQSL